MQGASVTAGQRLRILLVDDNELTRSVLRLSLMGDEFDVVGEAASGRAGLDAAVRLRPDMVCLDIKMPDMNGIDVLRAIKDALPGTTVLMVTASNDRETVQAAIGGGAAGFILKPFNTSTLQETMRKAARAHVRQRARPA